MQALAKALYIKADVIRCSAMEKNKATLEKELKPQPMRFDLVHTYKIYIAYVFTYG